MTASSEKESFSSYVKNKWDEIILKWDKGYPVEYYIDKLQIEIEIMKNNLRNETDRKKF